MSSDDLLISLAVGLVIVVLIAWIWRLHQRLGRLDSRLSRALGGSTTPTDLESQLVNYFDKLNATKEQLDRLRSEYKHLGSIAGSSFQKLGLVRFNPFRDTGGDQSFALCILDSQDCGLMVTAVHGREGTRVYAKPIQYGQSQGALSREEQSALSQARGSLPGGRKRRRR